MDPERWKQIDKIFHDALDREPAARASFLAETCKEDAALRKELEALLVAHEKESSLFESPASDLAAELIATKTGYEAKIAHYQILEKIGSGGMGDVYLAEDTRLNRKVALKLLPPEFTTDKDRVRRFEREAKTASALNHPNILTIYDIGQFNSSSFIASEYIDGETLRQRIRKSKMPLKEVLSISIQVVEALDAAHHTGIIHRDIKPENIMIRKDYYVKVLDFGLAKLIETQEVSQTSNLETLSKTEKGIVLGTIRYMSPEQARGLNIDARSDLFSFGVVLYEMITSRVPFDGATPSDVLAAILEKHPPAIDGEVPEELKWIVTKALAKDVEERYQTTKDFLADLKRIRKKIELNEELKRSGPTAIKQAGPNTGKKIIILSGVLMAIAAIAFFVTRKSQQNITGISRPFSKIKLTRLTSSGSARSAAISQDGKYVAYVQKNPQHQESLYIKQMKADTETSILSLPVKTFFHGKIRFSPDGNYIYYQTILEDKDFGSLYQIPILGGISRKLIEDISFVPAISPDGKEFAFVRWEKGGHHLMIAKSDGTQQRKIKSLKYPETYSDVEWSPDGKIITTIQNSFTKKGMRSQLRSVQLDGSERPIIDFEGDPDLQLHDSEWLSDGTGLILIKGTFSSEQLYHLSFPKGELTPITNDPNDYTSVSVTKDSSTLITTHFSYTATLWTAPSDRPERVNQITSGSIRDDGHLGISWTPSKTIIYSSKDPGGNYQLWHIQPDGTNQKQITSGKQNKYWPTVSPDGRYLVYNLAEGDLLQIWRADINGDNSKLLSGSKYMRFPRFTPDSKWIICSTGLGANQQLLKLAVDGTKEKILASHQYIMGGATSPDGKQIAYVFRDDADAKAASINIISSEGGKPIKTFEMEENSVPYGRLHWTPDGRKLAYFREEKEIGNIYLLAIDGSARYPLTKFTEKRIHNFSWSLDGKNIAYTRGTSTYDIVLIQNVP